jgi:putative DNA methylase
MLMLQWRSRGYLPHWEAGEVAQSITFRLADSLPTVALEELEQRLRALPNDEASAERRMQFERALDKGHGETWLSDGRIAELVEGAFLHFDGDRYRLHAWVVMPNHVHVVVTPIGKWTLASIAHSWKSFTATAANRLLNREGAFWAREYFDRAIRDDAHYANAVRYVERNPVKALLCERADQWRFSSAWYGR